jgi:hypothetical protein
MLACPEGRRILIRKEERQYFNFAHPRAKALGIRDPA